MNGDGERTRTVKFVEGFHDLPVDVARYLERGWTVYNAPRPLAALSDEHCWRAEFRHGVFYAAVPPAGGPDDPHGEAAGAHERNRRLDAWLCEVVTRDAIKVWYDALLARYPEVAEVYPWPASYGDVVHSWFNEQEE